MPAQKANSEPPEPIITPLSDAERQHKVNIERGLEQHGIQLHGQESGLTHVPMEEVLRLAEERQLLLDALMDALVLIDTPANDDTDRRKGALILLLSKLGN